MTKEEYIQLRQQNNLLILWLYYIEECEEKRIEQLIGNTQDLLSFLSMWGNINEIYADVIKKLDNKFTITKIYNKEQQIIGII